MKIKTALIIMGLVLLVGGGIYIQDNFIMDEENTLKYQGPIPQGYDEEHFRQTGITKPLEE